MATAHFRSPSKAAEGRTVLVEGVVCRESNVANRLVNKRWMRLLTGSGGVVSEPPVLASYRHSSDAEPSKVWPITRACSVGDVEVGTFHLRVDTSTLVALVAAKYTDVEMVGAAPGDVCPACRGLALQRRPDERPAPSITGRCFRLCRPHRCRSAP